MGVAMTAAALSETRLSRGRWRGKWRIPAAFATIWPVESHASRAALSQKKTSDAGRQGCG
jgi:hypothetical protein